MGGTLNARRGDAVRMGIFTTLLILLTGTDAPPPPPPPPIAVVVNVENPVAGLSLPELKRIYLGKQTTFSDDVPIRLGVCHDLSAMFYRAALDMPAHAMKRHWIKMVFSGARAKPPELMASGEKVKQFVEANRGGIAFLPLEEVDERVKVIAVEEKLPSQVGYPLR